MNSSSIAFIGGGNMASALVGGLLKAGRAASSIHVVEPFAAQRDQLAQQFGVAVHAAAGAALEGCGAGRLGGQAAALCRRGRALCALRRRGPAAQRDGRRSAARRSSRATGSERVVRAMPNTPALIGQGIAGLYARDAVGPTERLSVEQVLAPTGQLLWVAREEDLDAVTALSGSGPAYVFYFVEAMMQAAVEMGLSEAQGRDLALATFAGATALAKASDDPPALLRERVTSKGGTTHAAISSLEPMVSRRPSSRPCAPRSSVRANWATSSSAAPGPAPRRRTRRIRPSGSAGRP